MQLNISARHLDLTPALSEYVHKKVEKAQRYFDSIIWAQAILAVEKHRHMAELVVHTPGSTFRTKGEAGDLYAAIDLAVHKLDVHLSRVKDKKRGNKHRQGADIKALRRAESEAVLAPDFPVIGALSASKGANGGRIEVSSVPLRTLPLNQAVKEWNADGKPAFLFVNGKTNKISVLYRKGKTSYGVLEADES